MKKIALLLFAILMLATVSADATIQLEGYVSPIFRVTFVNDILTYLKQFNLDDVELTGDILEFTALPLKVQSNLTIPYDIEFSSMFNGVLRALDTTDIFEYQIQVIPSANNPYISSNEMENYVSLSTPKKIYFVRRTSIGGITLVPKFKVFQNRTDMAPSRYYIDNVTVKIMVH